MLLDPSSKQCIGYFPLFFPYRFSIKIFFVACHSIAPRAVRAKSAVPVPAGILHLNSLNLLQTPSSLLGLEGSIRECRPRVDVPPAVTVNLQRGRGYRKRTSCRPCLPLWEVNERWVEDVKLKEKPYCPPEALCVTTCPLYQRLNQSWSQQGGWLGFDTWGH